MSDLVERLRLNADTLEKVGHIGTTLNLFRDSADEIIRLRTLLGRCGYCDAALEDGVCPYEVSQEDARALVAHAARLAKPGAEGDRTSSPSISKAKEERQ